MQKAREPNDKLDHATDRTLAEADRKALRGLCQYSKLERYGGLPVFKALKVNKCGYFELDTSFDGEPMESL